MLDQDADGSAVRFTITGACPNASVDIDPDGTGAYRYIGQLKTYINGLSANFTATLDNIMHPPSAASHTPDYMHAGDLRPVSGVNINGTTAHFSLSYAQWGYNETCRTKSMVQSYLPHAFMNYSQPAGNGVPYTADPVIHSCGFDIGRSAVYVQSANYRWVFENSAGNAINEATDTITLSAGGFGNWNAWTSGL